MKELFSLNNARVCLVMANIVSYVVYQAGHGSKYILTLVSLFSAKFQNFQYNFAKMNPTHYPPAITPGFMGISPPHPSIYSSPNGSMSYFQNFRNENLSRMHVSHVLVIFTLKNVLCSLFLTNGGI